MQIYHIVLPGEWAKFKNESIYEANSLASEGFIHCSYRNQLAEVLERYYKDARRVLILHINPHLLVSKLIAETSTGGGIYPHIYGKINAEAIVKIEERNL